MQSESLEPRSRYVVKSILHALEIRITNLWPNRMIGDQQPSAGKKYTFASYRPYAKDSPLLESGLLGPVTVASVSMK
jgi:hypothetical protein